MPGRFPAPLKREDYLKDKDVCAFLDWATLLVTEDCDLGHPGEDASVVFKTVADAQRCYRWAGMDYETTVAFLGGLRARITESRKAEDPWAFLDAAGDVLKWGGVSGGNTKRLKALAEEALPLLELDARLLDPDEADLNRVWAVHPMNSGFSKIYSLMLVGFPIYDSRVACALGSLVRWFCHDKGYRTVPELLDFGMPPSREKDRAVPGFPRIHYGATGIHAESNVMAAWVLDELSKHGPFAERGDKERQFALQSAMFMIGHKPLASCD